MKKAVSILICCVILAVIFAGCGSDSGEETSGPPMEETPEAPPAETPKPEETPAPGDNGGDTGGETSGDINALLDQIYAGLDSSFELPMLMSTPLSNGMEFGERGLAYFIGTNDVPIVEGVASEAAIGAIPYSVCLVRLEPNTNAENAKILIRDNADPWKWICVGADTVIVDSNGDLVILIMTSEEHNAGLGEAIHEAFLAIRE